MDGAHRDALPLFKSRMTRLRLLDILVKRLELSPLLRRRLRGSFATLHLSVTHGLLLLYLNRGCKVRKLGSSCAFLYKAVLRLENH